VEGKSFGCFIMNFSWLGDYCWDLFISTNGMREYTVFMRQLNIRLIITVVLFKMFGLSDLLVIADKIQLYSDYQDQWW